MLAFRSRERLSAAGDRSMKKSREKKAKKGFCGNTLKMIAAVTMLIDHLAVVVLKGYVNARAAFIPEEQIAGYEILYDWMRRIGRMAFPLFAFLLVEGFFHTKDRKEYGQRLLLAALLSEIPYDLAVYGQVWCIERQNTIFTLFLGLVILQCMEWAKPRLLLQAVVLAAGCGLSWLCRLDYTYLGILLIGVFYFFQGYRRAAAVSGFCVFAGTPWSLPAFLLLPFYNGRRGSRPGGKRRRPGRRRNGRWFYLFYLIHLLVLYGMLQIILRIV